MRLDSKVAPGAGGMRIRARVPTLPANATRIDVIAYDAVADRASVRQFDLPGPKR